MHSDSELGLSLETTIKPAYETLRAIVFNRTGSAVLVLRACDQQRLPFVRIPSGARLAQSATQALETHFGEQAICLFVATDAPASASGVRYQVMQHVQCREQASPVTRWAALSAMHRESFVDPSDVLAIEASLAECRAGEANTMSIPFAHLGWFDELRTQVTALMERRGIHVSGNFRQLNAGHSFSLIRFETDGQAIWFKAVGEPNQREAPITVALTRLFPAFLPFLLGTLPQWNGWITQEAEGSELAETTDEAHWTSAATALGKLQVASAEDQGSIPDLGLRDLRLDALASRARPFINVMSALMDQQTKTSPPALRAQELQQLADQLDDALARMRNLKITDALGSLDLNPGNIIVSRSKSTFLDWAEAYVGNPFFSWQYLLEHYRRNADANTANEARLTAAYVAPWKGLLSPASIDASLALAPLLAVFAYATGNDLWSNEKAVENPTTAAQLRSLTRRMNREAKILAERRSPCQK